MNGWRLGWAALIVALVGANAAAEAANDAIRAAIAANDPKLTVSGIEGTPAKGLYRVSLEGASGYVTADGRYFIVGDMYELPTRRNLSEEGRQALRLQTLHNLNPKDAIDFVPPNAKHTLTVFTDVDCGYCRKLHSEISQLHAKGIGVRYLAYPRSGPNTDSWRKMQDVWCASDRGKAMTKAKADEAVPPTAGCEAPAVAQQYALGQKLGVQGTPTIVLDDGTLIGGYLPADKLAAEVERRSSKNKK